MLFNSNIIMGRGCKYMVYFFSLLFWIMVYISMNSETHKTAYLSSVHFNSVVNCKNIIAGKIKHSDLFLKTDSFSDINLEDRAIANISNCKQFKQRRNYVTFYTSEEEWSFPLAYVIMMHKNVGQVERLLRAIYRPQNVYCIHVDKNSSPLVFMAATRLASCFYNVHLSSKRFKIRWGQFSMLEADLTCMNDLMVQRNVQWKYLMTLASQEFPLRTNLELVRILKLFNGSNNIEGTVKRRNINRIPKFKTSFKVTWIKGSFRITVSRGFVDYALHNPRSHELLRILRQTEKQSDIPIHPDEQFYATLNYNPDTLHVPGAYRGSPETIWPHNPFISRFVNWYKMFPCKSGFAVRSICIWGLKDLPMIVQRKELFVNKFYWNFQPAALTCLEEWLHNRTRREIEIQKTATDFYLDFYKNFSFIKNHI